MELSVIICTHNPREVMLNRVLESLKAQTLPASQWELLVIDNHSRLHLSDALDIRWHPHGKVIREDEIGLTRARARGFRESAGDLVVLVDDDNLLEPDYLENARRLSLDHSSIGALGGSIIGEFETPPPKWFAQFEYDLLGVRPLESDCWSNLPWLWETTPIGAGLVVRKVICNAYLELLQTDPLRAGLDRRGKSLISAGDSDITQTACRLGFGTGRFSALKLKHFISKERLEPAYLARLAEGIGLSQSLLERLQRKESLPTGTRLYRTAAQILDTYRLWRMNPQKRRVRTAFHEGRKQGLSMPLDTLLSHD